MKYCDCCGEREPEYTYLDTVIGTEDEIENSVCTFCAQELYDASVGKDCPIQLRRMDQTGLHPSMVGLFDYRGGE